MLKSILCDCSDADILVKDSITVVEQRAYAAAIEAGRSDKLVIFINYAPFRNCMSKINNTQGKMPRILMLQWQWIIQ